MNPSELQYAKMEPALNDAEDAYFDARPQLMRSIEQETLFRAGFRRAWQLLVNTQALESPAEQAPQPLLCNCITYCKHVCYPDPPLPRGYACREKPVQRR